jgi:hypothetical protein
VDKKIVIRKTASSRYRPWFWWYGYEAQKHEGRRALRKLAWRNVYLPDIDGGSEAHAIFMYAGLKLMRHNCNSGG